MKDQKLRRLNDITLSAAHSYEKHRQFNGEMHAISHLYTDLISSKYKFPFWKLIIKCYPDSREFSITNLLGLVEITQYLDFDTYWRLSDQQKREFVLDQLHQGALKACKHFHISPQPFIEAKEGVIARGYRYIAETKECKNPATGIIAKIQYEYLLDKLMYKVIFFDKKKQILETVDLATTEPHSIFLSAVLGKQEWLSDTTFQVTSKDGNVRRIEFQRMKATTEQP